MVGMRTDRICELFNIYLFIFVRGATVYNFLIIYAIEYMLTLFCFLLFVLI